MINVCISDMLVMCAQIIQTKIQHESAMQQNYKFKKETKKIDKA